MMGQFYKIVNLDKHQYLDTHKFGDGCKLMEFGCSSMGTLTALTVLLADGNGRGSGDLHSDNPVIGSWAGDRIVIAGDYADGGKFLPDDATQEQLQAIANVRYTEGHQDPERVNLYSYAAKEFEDISEQALAAMLDDHYIKASFADGDRFTTSTFSEALETAQEIQRTGILRPDLVISS